MASKHETVVLIKNIKIKTKIFHLSIGKHFTKPILSGIGKDKNRRTLTLLLMV